METGPGRRITFRCGLCFPLALMAVTACGVDSDETSASEAGSRQLVRSVVASEELIIELQPKLKSLLSGKPATELFSEPAIIDSRLEQPVPGEEGKSLGIELRSWKRSADAPETEAASAHPGTPGFDDLMVPLKTRNLTYEHARFAIVEGRFSGQEKFHTRVKFDGLAHARGSRRLLSVHSEHEVQWEKTGQPGGDASDWKIQGWKCSSITTLESPGPLFTEVLSQSLPDRSAYARARTSLHRKILLENYFGGKPANLPKGYSDSRFYPDSVNIHPALSVVDIDGDGWDDLYVCVRWGKNLLLRNRGDGTFEESAAGAGLDIDGRNTSATFADFDNDGDPDLMLGRSLEQSLYLENVEGKFVRRPGAVAGPGLPWLVTSTSAADYNGDGLLDVYFCTYSPLDINTRLTGRAGGLAPEWARKFLPEAQAREVVERTGKAHSYLGQVGPPNVLFINRGNGKFEVAPESAALAGWRNTFQGVWSDFDQDGDQDLYVANDFAPDLFYRNDLPAGFTEISKDAGIDRMGFAMGAAWGDYDNDGREDLYVSNMYSKAGRRITGQIPGLDPRFRASSEGNYLFKNLGTEFRLVSSKEPPGLPVAMAGWSWGGQFADFDNDGCLDLYVSSGFYTPPKKFAIDVDL